MPGLGEQALRLGRIIRVTLDTVVVPPDVRRRRALRDGPPAAEHHLDELVPIYTVGDRLTERLTIEGRAVDAPLRRPPVAGWILRNDLNVLRALEARNVLRIGRARGIEFPGADHRPPDGRIRNDAVDDAVEIRLALVPVAAEAPQRDVIVRHPLDELEGTRSHRMAPEIFAILLPGRRRHHESRTLRERGQEAGVRLFQMKDDRGRAGRLHTVHERTDK